MPVKRLISSLLIILYAYIYVVGQASANKLLIAASIFFAATAVLVTPPKGKYSYLLIVGIAVISLLTILLNHTYPIDRLIFNVLYIDVNILLCLSIYFRREMIPFILRWCIYGLMTFIVICFCIATTKSMHIYAYMDIILKGFSYNYISGLLLLSSTLYFCYYQKLNLSVKYGKSLIFLIVLFCFMLYGRSGIIFSLLLACGYLKNYLDPRYGRRVFFILVCGILASAFIGYHLSVIYDVVENSKFKEGLQSPRLIMLNEYYSSLNFNSIIMGVDITKLPTIASYNINPHNSYLNFHAMFGVVSIVAVVFILLTMFNLVFVNFGVFVFLAVYIGRGFLDTIILPGVFDFIFFAILFTRLPQYNVPVSMKGT